MSTNTQDIGSTVLVHEFGGETGIEFYGGSALSSGDVSVVGLNVVEQGDDPSGSTWEFNFQIINGIYQNDALAETIFTAMRRIDSYLDNRGYLEKTITADIDQSPYDPSSYQYYLEITIEVDDPGEWYTIEEDIQDIVLESEVEGEELYAIVDRARE